MPDRVDANTGGARPAPAGPRGGEAPDQAAQQARQAAERPEPDRVEISNEARARNTQAPAANAPQANAPANEGAEAAQGPTADDRAEQLRQDREVAEQQDAAAREQGENRPPERGGDLVDVEGYFPGERRGLITLNEKKNGACRSVTSRLGGPFVFVVVGKTFTLLVQMDDRNVIGSFPLESGRRGRA